MTENHLEFERLLGQFLDDTLEDEKREVFYELLADPSFPERQVRVEKLLDVQERLEHLGRRSSQKLSTSKTAALFPIASSRRLPIFSGLALAATLLLVLLVRQWPETVGESELPYNLKGAPTGFQEVGLFLHIALRDPATGREDRADALRPVPDSMQAAPILRCKKPCEVATFRVDTAGAVLVDQRKLSGPAVRVSEWQSLSGQGPSLGWVSVAWPEGSSAPTNLMAVVEEKATSGERREVHLTITGAPP